MFKKFLHSFLAVVLLFSLITPYALANTNGGGNEWNYGEYDEVIHGDKWQKKYHIQVYDNFTGEISSTTIFTINNSSISPKVFSLSLPKNYELLEFREEVNTSFEDSFTTNGAETLFDIGAFTITYLQFAANPTFWGGAAVVFDGLAVIFPFVPAVGGITLNAIKSSSKMKTAVEYGIRPYKELTNYTSGKDLHAHHIMPKKFAGNFGISDNKTMFSIALDPTSHFEITGRFNSLLHLSADQYSNSYIIQTSKNIYMELYYKHGDYIYKFMADFIDARQYAPRK